MAQVVLHHYVTRSLSEFVGKMQRGPGGSRNARNLDWLRAYDGNSTETCTDGVALWRECCAERYRQLMAQVSCHGCRPVA
jgi:hypothetical protein